MTRLLTQMNGLPPDLYNEIREGIIDCCLESDLRHLFVDARLALWRDHVPGFTGLSSLARAEALIHFLVHQATINDENGLVLFLTALSDTFDPEDSCHEQLKQLAGQLAQTLAATEAESTEPGIPVDSSLLLGHVKISLKAEKDHWLLQAQNISQEGIKKSVLYLRASQTVWVNKNKVRLGTLAPQAISAATPIQISVKQPQIMSQSGTYQLGAEIVYQVQDNGRSVRLQGQFELFFS
jgi:hypothetical protein